MIITPKIQGTEVLFSLGRRAAPWALALAVGSIFLACSGTIETPTDEYPSRSSNAATEDEDEDEDDAPAAGGSQTGNAPRPTPPAAPAADDEDDDDRPTAPAANEDDDPPAAEAPPADDDEPPAAGGGATLAFEADIWPIFNTTCGPCHAGGGLGGNNIGDPDVATAFEDASRVADRVIARIEAGGMPPACSGGAPGDSNCISADDFDLVKAWVEAGSPE